MKYLKPLTFPLFITFLLLTGIQCKKDETGIEALPPATQEGKNTFGCLVNGEAYLPRGNFSSGNPINCAYQYVFDDKSYSLVIAASNNSNPNLLVGVLVNYRGPDISSIGTYELNSNEFKGEYYTIGNKIISFETSDLNKGELKITKFDKINQIISGTFWFDAVNDKGEKVEVREGRFDCLFKK